MTNQTIHNTHSIEQDGDLTRCSRCKIESTTDQWNEGFKFPCVPHYSQFIGFTKEGELKVTTLPEKNTSYQYIALCCMGDDSFKSGVVAGMDVMNNLLKPFFELGVLALCEAVAETGSLEGLITEHFDIGNLGLEPAKLLELAKFINNKLLPSGFTDQSTIDEAIEAWEDINDHEDI